MTARDTGRGFWFGGVRARAAALSASILLVARAATISSPSAICTCRCSLALGRTLASLTTLTDLFDQQDAERVTQRLGHHYLPCWGCCTTSLKQRGH